MKTEIVISVIGILGICSLIYGIVSMMDHHSLKHKEEHGHHINSVMVLSFVVPIAGFIIYAMSSGENKIKARGALHAALWSIGIITCIWIAYFIG